MPIRRSLTIVSALVFLIVLLIIGYLASRPRGPVLVEAEFGLSTLTPNADGESDITPIRYRIRRPATLSIYLENENGDRFAFRDDEVRDRGRYEVNFSGIVDGYVNDGEVIQGDVLARLIPDGDYVWVVEAADMATDQIDRIDGTITIADSDSELPDLWEFSVSPETFTPNQDGLNDRVWINVFVPKDADLQVYLIDELGNRIFIPEFQNARVPGEEGRHSFEYDGGIDNGSDPPPDGSYTIVVEAMDAEGQHVKREGSLAIQNGGVPLAEIVAQPVGDTVRFSAETVILGDILTFEVTVWNYGDAPIRTTGPEPGYVYEQDELYSRTGFFEESGAWRLGINCDTCLTDYPWRWGLGSPDTLTAIESDGTDHYYLMPGERAVVTGGIRLLNIVESRNPQQFWAGLIHEDVGIAPLNNRVDPHWIELLLTEPLTPDSSDS